MDNSSKQNPNESGQIFSGGKEPPNEQSAYQAAVFSSAEETKQETQSQESAPQAVYQEPSSPPPPDDTFSPPPPFVEDPRRKFLTIILILILILGGGFFLLKFLTSKKSNQTASSSKTKITLNYWGLWEEPEVLRPIFEKYQKTNPSIEIKYQRQDTADYRERLQAAIERGDGPDIFRFHNTWMPMMAKYNSPLPKDVMSDDEFKKTFYPVVSRDLNINGYFYGLPLEIDGLMLFYNEDILNGAGVAVPKTWVDIQNAQPLLTVKDSNNRIITSAIALGTAGNIEHFSEILGLMMLQNGTQLNKSLTSCGDSGITDCAVQALTFYHSFAGNSGSTWDDSLENSITAFAGGKVAMIFAPSWQATVINQINPNLHFKTAKLPQLPCNQNPCPEVDWATYWTEGVSVKSKHQKEAWQFLKYMVSPETQQALYAEQSKVRKLFGEPYSRTDLGKNLKDNPYLAPLISMAPNMQSFYLSSRTFDGATGLDSSLINYLKDAVNSLKEGGVSEETAIKTADSGFQEVFNRFNLVSPQ